MTVDVTYRTGQHGLLPPPSAGLLFDVNYFFLQRQQFLPVFCVVKVGWWGCGE